METKRARYDSILELFETYLDGLEPVRINVKRRFTGSVGGRGVLEKSGDDADAREVLPVK
jgi:hypothetical protein